MLPESDYFSYLYEIASCLNREFSLHAALRKALEKTVQLLGLETGWIWLMQENNSVYLAASFNLPPALKEYPERLSGKCFCLEKYLTGNIHKAANISEIACTRLKNLQSGTKDLRFHATVPILMHDKKVGLINLVSKEHQELSRPQLCVLNTIGELIGIAIQRTRAQDAQELGSGFGQAMHEILQRVFRPKLQELLQDLEIIKHHVSNGEQVTALEKIEATATLATQLKGQLTHILDEYAELPAHPLANGQLHHPFSSLTSRELDLLVLVRKGYTNKQIAEALFISERTVKFHMSSILQKLSAATRTEAVDIALKRGLLSL